MNTNLSSENVNKVGVNADKNSFMIIKNSIPTRFSDALMLKGSSGKS